MDQEHYVAYIREEANYEVARLRTLLRNSRITEEERGIVLAMLEFYEDARTVEGTFAPQSLEPLDLHVGCFKPHRTRRPAIWPDRMSRFRPGPPNEDERKKRKDAYRSREDFLTSHN